MLNLVVVPSKVPGLWSVAHVKPDSPKPLARFGTRDEAIAFAQGFSMAMRVLGFDSNVEGHPLAESGDVA